MIDMCRVNVGPCRLGCLASSVSIASCAIWKDGQWAQVFEDWPLWRISRSGMKVVDGLVDESGIGVHEVGLRLARATSLHDSPLDDREEKRKMGAENDATGKLYTFRKALSGESHLRRVNTAQQCHTHPNRALCYVYIELPGQWALWWLIAARGTRTNNGSRLWPVG